MCCIPVQAACAASTRLVGTPPPTHPSRNPHATGPAIVPRVKSELAACLARDGFACVADAVGADHPGLARQASGGAKKPGRWW